MKRTAKLPRRISGFTLVEMIISMTVLSTLMTAVTVILRTSRQAWETHQSDLIATQTAHATIRHIVRELREADSIVSVTPKTATSGSLTIRASNGTSLSWQHNETTKQVLFTDTSISASPQVLAENLSMLRFTAFCPDGLTETSAIEQMQFIKIDTAAPAPAIGGSRAMSSWVWLRMFGRNQAE